MKNTTEKTTGGAAIAVSAKQTTTTTATRHQPSFKWARINGLYEKVSSEKYYQLWAEKLLRILDDEEMSILQGMWRDRFMAYQSSYNVQVQASNHYGFGISANDFLQKVENLKNCGLIKQPKKDCLALRENKFELIKSMGKLWVAKKKAQQKSAREKLWNDTAWMRESTPVAA